MSARKDPSFIPRVNASGATAGAAGPQGPTGPAGVMGPAGPTGATGAAGATIGATPLSSILPAVAPNTINSADFPQVWNWTPVANNQVEFTFGEQTAASGSAQVLVQVKTLATSTATPLQVNAHGATAFLVTPDGRFSTYNGRTVNTRTLSATTDTVLESDDTVAYTSSSNTAVSLPAGLAGTRVKLKNAGTGTVTVTPNGADTIFTNIASASLVIYPGNGYELIYVLAISSWCAF